MFKLTKIIYFYSARHTLDLTSLEKYFKTLHCKQIFFLDRCHCEMVLSIFKLHK